MLEISLLGCGGMVPLPERRLTSMLIRHNGKMVLVDCGEGTQVAIRQRAWGFKNIDALCITHYHADHIAGLPGFLLTLGNSGRTEPFTILGPPPLHTVVSALTIIAPQLPYDLILKELSDSKESRLTIGDFRIGALPMDHMIPCLAYRFEINRAGKFDAERAANLGIPKEFWGLLQKGNHITVQEKDFTPDMVLGPSRKGLKVTYSTDTRPTASFAEFCKESDLLILEGIYGEDELREKAMLWKHMIFSEAAAIANESESCELWLTHFSPALKEPELFLGVAKEIFSNTIIGQDLMVKELKFND